MVILSADNLRKEYHQGEVTVYALDGVSLKIEKGSFVAITGESGSGKSTLLNILACMDVPTSGKVYFDGKTIPNDDRGLAMLRGSRFGMIFQAFHLLPMLTAEENMVMPVRFAGGKVDEKIKDQLLKRLGLEGRENHLPSQLSGGQQQRVAIGRALINHPQILFADEPTGNLDKKNSEEIIQLMIELKKEFDMTLVVVTHSEKIAEMADRRIYMEDGRIIKDEQRNA